MRRALRGLVLAGAGATIVVASALAAAPASAHNYPVGSTPAEGATVTVQPDVISLTTNDNLLDFGSSSAIQVSGPSDAPLYYGDGCATVTDATVETTAQLGAPGEYTVQWQVVSTDGHPVSGSFTFDWEPDASQVLAEGSQTAPVCPTAAPEESAPGVADAPADAPAASTASVTDLLWIVGAVAAVVAAIGITLLVLRRRAPRE